jgi:hypothetical protein
MTLESLPGRIVENSLEGKNCGSKKWVKFDQWKDSLNLH